MTLQINPQVLQYYVSNADIAYDELKDSVKYCEEFLSGERQPTFNQLSAIARKINVPTGLLLLDGNVDLSPSQLEFRTLDGSVVSKISDELRDTINEMQTKQDFLRHEIDYRLDFIGQYSIGDDVMQVAIGIRQKLDLKEQFQLHLPKGSNALNFLRQKISDLGVFVFFNGKVKDNTHRLLRVDEFRGFVLCDDKAPIIFINQADSKTGQLFTLAHELVHLFLGSDEVFTVVDTGSYQFDKAERFVNQVTAELLLPKSVIDSIDMADMDSQSLAKQYAVSEFVVVRRLYDLGRITKSDYQSQTAQLKAEFEANQYTKTKKSTGGNYPNNTQFRIDKRFMYFIQNAINDQRLSYTDAFAITGVGMKGFKALKQREPL